MQENMHIVISVKDFKAIVTHAETLRGAISAHFSFPTKPLQFCYQNAGMHCEFTLMTTGDFRGASSTPNPHFVSTRASSRQPSVAPVAAPSISVSEMPPPARPAVSKPLGSQRERVHANDHTPQRHAADPDPDPESLFVPGGDDDNTWDPPNYEQDEEEMLLGWDASNENPNASFHPTFRDSGTVARPQETRQPPAFASQEGLEPTQRLSQLHGMFD
jgi:cell cycle checkpoint control protein RAD9A